MIEDNFIRTIEDSLRRNWNEPAMTDYRGDGITWTYADVAREIAQLHDLYTRAGIRRGDTIALVGKNSRHWAAAYLSILTYGAVAVPILQDFRPADMVHIINHSDSRLLLADPLIAEQLEMSTMPMLRASISLTDYMVIEEQVKDSLPAQEADVQPEEPLIGVRVIELMKDDVRYEFTPNSELASINYTSGTTGFSKGVMTPLNALASNVRFALQTGLGFPGSRFVAFLPLAHAFGCAFDFLSNFCAGGHTCYFGRTPSPKILIDCFQQFKPTAILSVPLVLEKVYKKQIVPMLSKPGVSWVMNIPLLSDLLKYEIRQTLTKAFGENFSEIILGGAPLNAEVEAFLLDIGLPITIGYGMTECAPIISYTSSQAFKKGSAGMIVDEMQVRVADANEEGIGELQVCGENVMLGYYKNEEATRLSFTEDGWLKTGDLGRIDADGTIYIKGRNKTMLLGPSGQNIFPEEIEAVLNNMPYVTESLVMQREDKIVALVYPDYEECDRAHLQLADLREAMEKNRKETNKQVAGYEQINEIRIYPHEFEKTPKKSIKRFLYNANMGE